MLPYTSLTGCIRLNASDAVNDLAGYPPRGIIREPASFDPYAKCCGGGFLLERHSQADRIPE
jgi:hypothetical protein